MPATASRPLRPQDESRGLRPVCDVDESSGRGDNLRRPDGRGPDLAFAQQLGRARGGRRRAEVESLGLLAAEADQDIGLGRGFHALFADATVRWIGADEEESALRTLVPLKGR